jgi:DNA polymerase III sliding clamp (beta) subunit (PCNA family)
LESALSRCFDACEKKTAESLTQFIFENDKLILSAKGYFTYYEECIDFIECSENAMFTVKTATILEFVKHVSSDCVLLAFDEEKKSCLISSSDKKSKIALQVSDTSIENNIKSEYSVNFSSENPHEIISKLNFASKFCSNNFQDHPLSAIHCEIDINAFNIKSTNGPSFYSSSLPITSSSAMEIFLPKKAPAILKNVFHEQLFNKCSFDKRSVLFESDKCKLTFFVEQSNSTFPDQVREWIKKDSNAKIKASVYELSKTLKFFNGVFNESSVNFNIKDGKLNLESKENNLAAKENVATEECTGDATSAYNSKYFLDCLESLQSSWVNLDFIEMSDSFYICKLTHGSTLILLCPTTF